MKILAIRGKNLASLEGEFDIDFAIEPLKSAGIFAITGQTGAGKSTILDALCLALFDNAPRLNKAEASVNLLDVEDKTITQKDSRNILRRGAAEGYAEVDFVALNGDRYRSRWMVRRARGKSDGALQATSIKLENLKTNSEEQGTKSNLLNRVVELIGLTFDQFIRAVLLAQGDFANFLKAKSSEKAELLEKLTGTEIYSKISTTIYNKTSEAKNSLDLLLHRIKDIKLLSEEELQMAKDDKAIKNKDLIPLKEEIKRIEKKIVWIKENEQIKQEVDRAERELENVRITIKDALPRYEYMSLIDKSMEIRDSYLEYINKSKAQNSLKLEIENNELTLKTVIGESENTNKKISEIKVERDRSEIEYNNLKPDIDLAKELDIKISMSSEAQSELKKEIEGYNKQLATSDQTILNLRESQERVIKDKLHLDDWFSANDKYKAIVSKVELIVNIIDTASSALKQKDNASDSLKVSRSMFETYRLQLASLEAEFENLNKLMPAEIINIRHKLIEGEACPVCGSLHHPIKENVENVQEIKEAELEAKKQDTKNNIDRLKIQIEQTQMRITELDTYVKNFEQQYLNSFFSLKESLEKYPNWESKFETCILGKELSDLSSIWNQNKTKLDECTILLETISTKIIAEEKLKTTISENLLDKRKAYATGEDSERKMSEQRKLLIKGLSVEEVEKYYRDLRMAQSKLLETLEIEKEKVEAKKAALYGKIEQQKIDTQSNQIEIDRLKRHIQQWLTDDRHQMTAETLKDLITKSRDWINQEKHYLSELQNKQLSIDVTLNERKNRNLKHLDSEDKPEENETKDYLSERLVLISEQTENINKCLSEIEVSLLAHEKGKEQIKLFEKELCEKTELYENWAKLNDLLGSANGNKFKNIAQEYTLDVLLSYANKHLEELTKRYRLEKITGTLALQVVDNDMLGEVRSVHSLSGGESFLISLALALGLSSLSSNKMKIESLFIDEGFGALDIETLSVAMDALDNLQTQGRKIGVISHVEEMKERITTQIQVTKLSNGKSNVKIVG